jgi:hypothetical protein
VASIIAIQSVSTMKMVKMIKIRLVNNCFSHLLIIQLFSDICFVLFAMFNCIWSTAYLESWKRKQAELAFRWGTFSMNSETFLDDPRPSFKVSIITTNYIDLVSG